MNPDSAMTAHDWGRLARLAIREAVEWEAERDDASARAMAKSYRALAAKCDFRAEELEAGRVVP